jgi:NTE family protein
MHPNGNNRADALDDAPTSVPAAESRGVLASATAGQAVGRKPDSPPSRPLPGRPIPLRRRPRTAFVLSGGASLGSLQAGMLCALYERGIAADMLIGTSAGALNAAYIASRPQTVHSAKQLLQVWRGLYRQDVFPIHPPTLVGGLANHRAHLVPDRPLRRLISRHLELERLEDGRVPLHVVTFDLLSGKEVRLSEGPALDGVLAAASIPGVLPPVPWGGQLLVDGGVVNNTPISHAIELGAQRIYVLATVNPTDRALARPPSGPLNAAMHAFTLLVGARLEADLARYGAAADLIVLPAANPSHVRPTDFGQADRLFRAALQAGRGVLRGAPVRQPIAA